MRNLDQNSISNPTGADKERLAHYIGPELAAAIGEGRPRDHDIFLAASILAGTRYAILTYLPQRLVARQMAATDAGPWLEWLDGALLFADVSGLTDLAERLTAFGREGAEVVTETLTSYFGTMIRIIEQAGGDLLTFGGDSLLVLFDGPDPARAATATALTLLRELAGFVREVPGIGSFPLMLHIGVEAGSIALVSTGHPQSLRYCVMGRTVHNVARAEGYGGKGELILGPRAWIAVGADASGMAVLGSDGFVRVWSLGDAVPIPAAPIPVAPAPTPTPALTLAALDDLVRQIDRLSPYLPTDLLARFLADPNQPGVKVDLQPVTVLFAQIIGLGTLIERRPPAEAAAAIDAVLRPLQAAVSQLGGFVNKLDLAEEGDKLMAVFGVPVAHEDHAKRAARAALLMVQALKDRAAEGLFLRIGLNTGNVFAGNVGTAERKEYIVMGEAVNVAARIMAIAAWGEIRCAAVTANLLDDTLACDDPRHVTVKDKGEPVELLRLTGEREAAAHIASDLPLIGRAAELAWLRGHLDGVVDGHGRAVRVYGEAGIGKSRLAAALLEEAAVSGARVVTVRCLAYNSTTPYAPWGSVLRDICEIGLDDNQPARARKLADALTVASVPADDWLPLLADLVRLDAEPNPIERALDPGQRQARCFEIILDLLRAAARGEPERGYSALIILLDNLQWADQVSLDLWQYIAGHCTGDRILLLGLHRHALEWGSGLQGDGADVLELSPLSPDSGAALLDTLAGGRLSDDLRTRLVARAAGNPLFLEEMLRAVESSLDASETLVDQVRERIGPLRQGDLSAFSTQEASWALLLHLVDTVRSLRVSFELDAQTKVRLLITEVAPLLALSGLRELHMRLILRRRAAQEAQPAEPVMAVLDDVERFVVVLQIAGRLLEGDEERDEAQGLLSYWANLLYRAGRPVVEDLLDEFDPFLAPDIPDDRCPYLGLDAFREQDAGRFFGRRRIVEQLTALLDDRRLIAVVGPSGSGKSSVVRAGLIPWLQHNTTVDHVWQGYQVTMIVPGTTPHVALIRALAGARRMPDLELPALLVVDQFEEAFTLCTDEGERGRFLGTLVELAMEEASLYRVVLTMRSDFEPFVARAQGLFPLFEAGKLYLPPMSAGELREAIERPAESVGLRFEPGVVDALLQEIVGEPAALPLLQFTLLKLWGRRERNRITLAAYKAVGGGRLALARAADTLYGGLIPEEQITARRILLRLVRPGEGLEVTSNRVRRTNLLALGEDPGRVERVLDKLISARLIRLIAGEAYVEDQVEIAHEALVRNWPTLVDWLEDERLALRQRQRLSSAAEQWERLGRDASTLLRGALLEEARRYDDLSLLEREFVHAGFNEQERVEQEREDTIRRLKQLTADLERQRRLAETQRLAFAAQSLAGENPELAVLLAYEAAATEDSPITQQALRDALAYASWQPMTLYGHQGPVRAITFSPDSRSVATASVDGTARLWSAEGEPLVVLKGHRARVWTVAFSPDGTTILTTSRDRSARLWDRQGKCLSVFGDHPEGVRTAGFSHDGLRVATASEDGSLRIWSIYGEHLLSLTGHTGDIRTVAFNRDDTLLASGSDDGTARLWDAHGSCTALIRHQRQVRKVAFHPDGQLLLTASFDKTACLWTLEGTEVAVLKGHTDLLWSALFTYDGQWVVTSSQDGTVRVWDLTGREIDIMRGHTNLIQQIVCSVDNRLILSASHDRTARLWNRSAGETAILSGHANFVRSVALSPDSAVLVTASEDATARIWRPGVETRMALRGHQQRVHTAVYDCDGLRIATASDDGTARVWSILGEELTVLPHDGAIVYSVAFTSDGSRIVTGASDGRLRLWSNDGRLLHQTDEHVKLRRVAVSPDNLWVAAGYDDGTVRLYDLAMLDQAQPKRLAVEGDAIRYTAFSPDGRYMAVGGRASAYIVQITDGSITKLSRAPWGFQSIFGLAWSPDGACLVTAAADHTARIWTLDGRELAVLRGHTDWVMAAAWSPDGSMIVTGSADRTLWLWTSVGERLSAIHERQGSVHSVAFSPDSRRIVVASSDCVVRQYLIKTSDLLQLAGCRVGRGLTEDEIARFNVPMPLKLDVARRQCPPVFPWDGDGPAGSALMSSTAPAVRLIFTDADQTHPDPAAVGAAARTMVSGLQAVGEQVTAAYTGENGTAEVFLWIMAASTSAQTLIALPDLALKVAQLLNEIKNLRVDEPDISTTQLAPPTITIILQIGDAKATLSSDTTPADVRLLTEVLAEQLPAQINLADVTAEVRVPPTPPNEL